MEIQKSILEISMTMRNDILPDRYKPLKQKKEVS